MQEGEWLSIVRGDGETAPTLRLGVIPAGYASGPAQVQFDGETIAGVKKYKVADHVTLAVGKCVLVAMVGNSGVIVAAFSRP